MRVALLVCFVAALAAGCKPAVSSNPPGVAKKTAPAMEHQTVELAADSGAMLRERVAQWQREGWSVQSISRPQAHADGTLFRTVELSKYEL